MAPDVFCQSLDADINVVSKGIEQNAGGIGVVECHQHTARMGRSDNGWHILNFHRDRSGAFAPDQLRGVRDQLTNAGPDHWVIGLDLDAETAQ